MWFKDIFLFLSYTALLVTPTNAVFDGQDDVVSRERGHLLVPEQVAYKPVRRAAPWSNQTTTASQVAQQPPPVLSTPVESSVVVTPTDGSQTTSTHDQKHGSSQVASSSAVVSEGPTSTAAVESKSSSAPANNPGRSSNVVPSSSVIIPTSEAAHPPSPEPSTAFTPPPPPSQVNSPVPSSSASRDHVGHPPVSSSSYRADEPKSTQPPSSAAETSVMASSNTPVSPQSLPSSAQQLSSSSGQNDTPTLTLDQRPSSTQQQPISTPSGPDAPRSTPIQTPFNAVPTSGQASGSSGTPGASFSTSAVQITQTGSDASVITSPPNPSIPLPAVVSSVVSDVGGHLSEILSEIQSEIIPSPIGGVLSSLLSDAQSVLIPSGTGVLIPSLGLVPTSGADSTPSGNIPASESLAISTGIPNLPSELASIATGISLPGFSGTEQLSTPTGVPTLSSQIESSLVNPTGTPQASLSGLPTTTPVSSGDLSVDLSLFSTPAPASTGVSDASGLATSQSVQTSIPASESQANPTTTPVTGLPTTLPAPGSTAGTSGSTNASDVSSSGVGISVTTGLTGLTTGTTPTRVDTARTSGKASLSNATGSSAISGATASASTGGSANPSDASTAFSGGSTVPSGASTALSGASTVPSGASTLPSGYDTLTASISGPNGFVVSTTTPPATSSTTAAAGGAEPKPAPLSKSQTAGIAIGGTTCLIIAIVAALFLARRYHANAAAKRNSTGSIYPEVAYLYDPPVPGNNDDAEAGGGVPTMSGGASGYGAVPRNSPAPSPRGSHHNRNSTVGSVYPNPFRDPIIPEPLPSPRLNGYGGPVGDARGEYAQLSINPYAYNPAAKEYPPMSPYGPAPVDRATSNRYSDPFTDPFEHDLLLNVDVRSETPDSILVLAPPPTPRSPRFPGRYSPENPAASSSQTSLAPPGRYTPSPENSSSSSLTNGRYTPENSSLAPSSNTALTSSPLTAPERAASPPPVHKGWEEIKLEDPVMVPKPLSVVSQVPRKPMPTRPTPALAGAGQMLLSGQGLPLTVKKKDVDRDLGLEVLSMSQVYGSPGPAIDEHNPNASVQRKRSGELLFADPQLIGREF